MNPPETMNDVMERLSETDQDTVDLYGTLAPVYEFVIEWATIPSIQHDHVTSTLDDPDSVVELACGMGSLLEKLDQSYDQVVGVDASQPLLTLARTKTDASLVRSDVRQWRPRARFDAAVMLGNSLGHLTGNGDARSCFERTAESLASGGQFLVTCHDVSAHDSEKTQEHVVENDEFRVEHESQLRSVDPETDLVERGDSFVITRTSTEKTVTAETGSWPFRAYDAGDVTNELKHAGFDVVGVDSNDGEHEFLAEKR